MEELRLAVSSGAEGLSSAGKHQELLQLNHQRLHLLDGQKAVGEDILGERDGVELLAEECERQGEEESALAVELLARRGMKICMMALVMSAHETETYP